MHLVRRISDPIRHIRRSFKSLFIDAHILFIAYVAAFAVRAVTASLDLGTALLFILFAILVTLSTLYVRGIYHRIWEQTSGHHIIDIIIAVGIASLIILGLDVIFQPRPLPVSVIVTGNVLALGGFVTVRYRSRLITGTSWRWRAVWRSEFPDTAPRTKVLIIGAGESGQTFAMRLKYRFPNNDYKIFGFIDDDPEKQGMFVEGCRVVGTHQDIPRIAADQKIDLIVVAIHNISGGKFRKIIELCEETSARIKVVPDLFALMNAMRGDTLLRDVRPEDMIGRKVITSHEAVDLSPVTNKIILVTGSAGSIGAELSRQLPDYAPIRLILLDNNESDLHDLYIELTTRHRALELIPVLADVTNKARLQHIFDRYRPDIVFHAAAYKHVPMLEDFPCEAVRINVAGTYYLAQIAAACGAERFVLISTDKAVNPTSIMGASKRVCELILSVLSAQQSNKTMFTAVRFGNVLGSRGSVVPTFEKQIDNGGPVTVTHRDMTRYFMSTTEAVNLIIHAACLTERGDVFLLNMGEVVHILELAERMIRLRGLRPYQDIHIEFTGVRPGEKFHEELSSDFELTTQTAHPNIFKLIDENGTFETDEFFNKLEELLSIENENRAVVFEKLLDITNIGNPEKMSQNGAGRE